MCSSCWFCTFTGPSILYFLFVQYSMGSVCPVFVIVSVVCIALNDRTFKITTWTHNSLFAQPTLLFVYSVFWVCLCNSIDKWLCLVLFSAEILINEISSTLKMRTNVNQIFSMQIHFSCLSVRLCFVPNVCFTLFPNIRLSLSNPSPTKSNIKWESELYVPRMLFSSSNLNQICLNWRIWFIDFDLQDFDFFLLQF